MLTSCRLGRLVVQTQRFKLVSSGLPRYQTLYDRVGDPLETHDISEQPPAEFANLDECGLESAFRRAASRPAHG